MDRLVLWEPAVIPFLEAYHGHFDPGGPIAHFCHVPYSMFRCWLRKLNVTFGFDLDFFRSHSLRRGGASRLALLGVPETAIQEAGRWARIDSCRLYIKKGLVLLTQLRSLQSRAHFDRMWAIASIACHVFDDGR